MNNVIEILGEKIAIKFNMAVEIAYEEITGEPFSIEALKSQKNSAALYMAVLLASKPDTQITMEKLINEADGPTIATLSTAVIQAMSKWMKLPSVITEEPVEKPAEEKN